MVIHEATTGLPKPAEKQKIVTDTETDWEKIPIEDMVQEISKDFKDANEVKEQVSKLNVKRVGLLKNMNVDELKAKGIDTIIATAIVEFIEKKQPHRPAASLYVIIFHITY